MMESKGNKRKAGRNTSITTIEEHAPPMNPSNTDSILADLRRSLCHVQTSIDSFYNDNSDRRSSSYDARSNFQLQSAHCINDEFERELADLREFPAKTEIEHNSPREADQCFERLRDCVRRQCSSVSPHVARKVALSDRFFPTKEDSVNNFPPHRKVRQIRAIPSERPAKINYEPKEDQKPKITPFSWRDGKRLITKATDSPSSNLKKDYLDKRAEIQETGDGINKDQGDRISRWSIDDTKHKKNFPASHSKSVHNRARNYSVKDVVDYMQRKRLERLQKLKNKKNEEIKAKFEIKKRLQDLHVVQCENATRQVPKEKTDKLRKNKFDKKEEAYFRTAHSYNVENADSSSSSDDEPGEPIGRHYAGKDVPTDKMAELMKQADLIRQRIAKASKEIKPLLNKTLSKNSRQNLNGLKVTKNSHRNTTQKSILTAKSTSTCSIQKAAVTRIGSPYINIPGNRRRVDGCLPLPGSLRDNYNIIDIVSSRFGQRQKDKPKDNYFPKNGGKTINFGRNIDDFTLPRKYDKKFNILSEFDAKDEPFSVSREFDTKFPANVDYFKEEAPVFKPHSFETGESVKTEEDTLENCMSTGDTETKESLTESLRYSPTSLAAKFSVELTNLDSLDKSLVQLGALRPPRQSSPPGQQTSPPKLVQKENQGPKSMDVPNTIEHVVKELDDAQQSYHHLLIEWLQRTTETVSTHSPKLNIVSLIAQLQGQMTAEKRHLNEFGMKLLSKRMEMINKKYKYSHLMASFRHLTRNSDTSMAFEHIRDHLAEGKSSELAGEGGEGLKVEDLIIGSDIGEENQDLKHDLRERRFKLSAMTEREHSTYIEGLRREGDIIKNNIELYDQLTERLETRSKYFESPKVEDSGTFQKESEAEEPPNSTSPNFFEEAASKADSYSTKFDSEEEVLYFDFSGKKEDEDDFIDEDFEEIKDGSDSHFEEEKPKEPEVLDSSDALDIVMSELSSDNSDDILSVKSLVSVLSETKKSDEEVLEEETTQYSVSNVAEDAAKCESLQLAETVFEGSVDDIRIHLNEIVLNDVHQDMDLVEDILKDDDGDTIMDLVEDADEEDDGYKCRDLVEHAVQEDEAQKTRDLAVMRSGMFARHFWPLLVAMGSAASPDYELSRPFAWHTESEHLIDDIIMSIVNECVESIRTSREPTWSWLPRKRVIQERRTSRECRLPPEERDFVILVESGVTEILFGEETYPKLKISRRVDEIDKMLISQMASEARLWRDYDESDAQIKEALVNQVVSLLASDTAALLARIYSL